MKKIIILRFIVSILTAIFLSSTILYYILSSKKQFDINSNYTLKSIAQEKANNIEAEINYAEGSIKLLSDFVSSQLIERELKNPNEVFSKYTKQLPFDLIEYVRWDGLNFMNSTEGGQPFDASDRPYYKEGIKGNSGIWPNFKPKVAKEVLLNFYTPIYYKGEISGVITGAIGETTSLKPMFISSFFGYQIQSFICDENYVVISSACENITPGLDLKKWDSIDILDKFIIHSNMNDSEPFKYTIDGRKGLCCTSRIESNGWHVAVIVYPSVLKAVKKDVSGNLLSISVFIFIVMLMYLVVSLALQEKSYRFVKDKLLRAAIIDELTGLYNRHAYEEDLRNLNLKPELINDNFNYVAFDVNGLKNVNDNMGHEAGDELIKAAASCINDCFGKYGKIYRTGGDEFIAIINASDEDVALIKEKFLQQTKAWKGKYSSILMLPAGFVSKKEMCESSILEMAKIADQRMYREKALIYITNGVDRRAKNAAYEVLCESYTKILKINLSTDDFNIIQMDPSEKKIEKGYSEKISKWLHDFGVSGQVHKDDVENYLSQTSLEYMKNYFLAGNKELNIQYRRLIGSEFYKVLMEIKPSKEYAEDNQICFLYVKNIDK